MSRLVHASFQTDTAGDDVRDRVSALAMAIHDTHQNVMTLFYLFREACTMERCLIGPAVLINLQQTGERSNGNQLIVL